MIVNRGQRGEGPARKLQGNSEGSFDLLLVLPSAKGLGHEDQN
jgi:hypothetical protein